MTDSDKAPPVAKRRRAGKPRSDINQNHLLRLSDAEADIKDLRGEIIQVEKKFRAFKSNVYNPKEQQDLIDNLKEHLKVLKIRINRGDRRPDDNYRQMALEHAIGNAILCQEGIL